MASLLASGAQGYLSEEPAPNGQFALQTVGHPHKVGIATVKPHRQGVKVEFEGQDLRKGKYTLLVSLTCPTPKEMRARKPASLGTGVVDFSTESGEMWIEHTIRTDELALDKPDQPLSFYLVRHAGAKRELVAASPCGKINPSPAPEVASPAELPATSSPTSAPTPTTLDPGA